MNKRADCYKRLLQTILDFVHVSYNGDRYVKTRDRLGTRNMVTTGWNAAKLTEHVRRLAVSEVAVARRCLEALRDLWNTDAGRHTDVVSLWWSHAVGCDGEWVSSTITPSVQFTGLCMSLHTNSSTATHIVVMIQHVLYTLLVTDHVSREDKAVGSVCPSVCLFALCLLHRMTFLSTWVFVYIWVMRLAWKSRVRAKVRVRLSTVWQPK